MSITFKAMRLKFHTAMKTKQRKSSCGYDSGARVESFFPIRTFETWAHSHDEHFREKDMIS